MTAVNKTIVLTAAIAALPPTIAAITTLIVSLQTHDAVKATAEKVDVVQEQTNGMQKALTAAATKVGEAKGEKTGVKTGVAIEKSRAAAAKANQAVGAATEKARPFWKK